MILWFITSMTSSFFLKMWKDMNRMFDLFNLDKFTEVGLYVKLEKCEFHEIEMEFLEYILFENDVCMDPHKV